MLLDGTETIVPAEQVKVGDVIRVLPGETVAVDGVILSGQTSVNQAVMTGESLPVDKTAGDEVSSGTVNQFGAFEMRAAKVGEDSSIQRMIRLVQSADAGKAKIVGLADRWATWIVVIALSAAGLTWAFTGEIIRAVHHSCCVLPLRPGAGNAYRDHAAIGNATKHGFLVREGDALERLSAVTKITFDKTGTLTYGTPKVTAVKSVPGYTADEVFDFAAAAEQLSEHPLGKAVVAVTVKAPLPAKASRCALARASLAVVGGKTVKAGNLKLLKGVAVSKEITAETDSYLNAGSAVIYIAVDDILAGYLVLSDTVREESRDMIAALDKIGVQPVLLTGDHPNAAGAIAGQLGIREVYANCLPEDKLNRIGAYQENGNAVCMIGDGSTMRPH